MPAIQLDEVESRILLTIHAFERPGAGATAEWLKRDSTVAPGWEDSVPKYLIYAVVQGKLGVSHVIDTPVDRAFHSLERLGLIEHSPPKFGRLLTGRWTLPDGRTIETRGTCAEHPGGGSFWSLDVFIDGTRAFGLSGPPDLSLMCSFPLYGCYRLTEKGLVVVRAQGPTDSKAATVGNIDDAAILSPRDLARMWGLSDRQDAVEKALSRADLPGDAKHCNENRKPREPQFSYRVGAARPILDRLRDKLSRECPAKKNLRA